MNRKTQEKGFIRIEDCDDLEKQKIKTLSSKVVVLPSQFSDNKHITAVNMELAHSFLPGPREKAVRVCLVLARNHASDCFSAHHHMISSLLSPHRKETYATATGNVTSLFMLCYKGFILHDWLHGMGKSSSVGVVFHCIALRNTDPPYWQV